MEELRNSIQEAKKELAQPLEIPGSEEIKQMEETLQKLIVQGEKILKQKNTKI